MPLPSWQPVDPASHGGLDLETASSIDTDGESLEVWEGWVIGLAIAGML
jgi:hypothetical protein